MNICLGAPNNIPRIIVQMLDMTGIQAMTSVAIRFRVRQVRRQDRHSVTSRIARIAITIVLQLRIPIWSAQVTGALLISLTRWRRDSPPIRVVRTRGGVIANVVASIPPDSFIPFGLRPVPG